MSLIAKFYQRLPTSFLPTFITKQLLDPTRKRDGITVELKEKGFLDQIEVGEQRIGKNLSGGEEVEENVEANHRIRRNERLFWSSFGE